MVQFLSNSDANLKSYRQRAPLAQLQSGVCSFQYIYLARSLTEQLFLLSPACFLSLRWSTGKAVPGGICFWRNLCCTGCSSAHLPRIKSSGVEFIRLGGAAVPCQVVIVVLSLKSCLWNYYLVGNTYLYLWKPPTEPVHPIMCLSSVFWKLLTCTHSACQPHLTLGTGWSCPPFLENTLEFEYDPCASNNHPPPELISTKYFILSLTVVQVCSFGSVTLHN